MKTNLLLKKRIEKKQSFSEMANELGISESRLLAIENGKIKPCADFYKLLNEKYGNKETKELVI